LLVISMSLPLESHLSRILLLKSRPALQRAASEGGVAAVFAPVRVLVQVVLVPVRAAAVRSFIKV
jgi:hypothetical protein